MAGAVLCVCKAGEPREDSFLRGQNGEELEVGRAGSGEDDEGG